MPYGIFDKRLKDEEWTRNRGWQHIRCNLPAKVYGFGQPGSLQFEVLLHMVHLLGQRTQHAVLRHEPEHKQSAKSTEHRSCFLAFSFLQ